jgi:hypothetical protein
MNVLKARLLHSPLAIAVLMALSAPQLARADSGVGVDLWIANKLDPNAGASAQSKDSRGTSWLKPGENRNPTGFLYMCPAESPQIVGIDWQTYGVVELGYLGASGDTNNAIWQRYSDWSNNGFVVSLLDFHALRPADGSYVDVRGSYLSENNYYLKGVVGRAGSYKIEAFTRSTPNVVSGNAQSVWEGVGSHNLTLAGGLVPGASTPAQVAAVSAAAPERRLQVNRDKQGLGFSYYFDRQWTAYANFTNETREGSRPFGGPFFFNFAFADNGGVYETPRPIQDSTINSNLGLRFAGNVWRADIGYSGSFYRSARTGFTYEVPFALWNVVGGPPSASGHLTSGQFSSEPDNDYHNLRATLTRALPMNGQFSLSASTATMRQNDDLLAPINCTGTFGIDLIGNGQVGPSNPFLYSCADWNTTDALSRKTADMRIDTDLVDARFVLQPSLEMTWRGGLRYYREDYRNTYLAYNPITGDYGYVAENGSQGSVVPGEVGLWNPVTGASIMTRVMSLPLDTQSTEANVGFDWRMSSTNTLGATLLFTRNEPEHRERKQIDDTSVKLTWMNRDVDRLTLRANYVYLHRDGDTYNSNPYEFTFSEHLPGFVPPEGGVAAHTVDALRKYDMASRDQNKIDLMATFAARDDMTLSASLRGDWNDYDAQLGRQKLDTMGVTLQWEWQPSPRTNASLFLGYDRSKLGIANVNDAASDNPDPSLGGPSYPDSSRWWVDDSQSNRSVGFNFAHAFANKLRFDASWNWNSTRGSTDYRYASADALAWPTQATTALGGSYPDMTYRVNALTLGLTMPIRERVSLRVFDYYERGRISDWHYLGLDQGRVIDHRVYTDGGPENYNANLFGVLLTIKL